MSRITYTRKTKTEIPKNPIFYCQKRTILESKNWRNFPKKLAKLVQLTLNPKKKKNQIIPFLLSKKKKTLESKNWRNFPKKLAKLVELFDTRKTKKNSKILPMFFGQQKNNTVTGRPRRSAPLLILPLSVTARTDTGRLARAAHARFRNGRCDDDLPSLDYDADGW